MALTVVAIATPELGDRSYLVHDGARALVVDPQRDLDRVLAAAEAAGVEVTHVAETHVHNDYLSGGLELARLTGAEYLLAAGEEVGFERTAVQPGDVFTVGGLSVEVVATPGHTPHHVAYIVGEAGVPTAVCTGGSLLFGSVGRTDLVDTARTRELAGAQHRSVRELAERLGDAVAVLPTHGFGSFCSSGPASAGEASTIGDERRSNLALRLADEEEFVEALVGSLGAYPRYYAAMAPRNRAGVGPMPASPEPIEPGELLERFRAGQWVVDLRHRRAFAAAHVAGTVGFELAQPFTTYLGWVVPEDAGVVLLCQDPAAVAEASRCLARIGRDRLAGRLVGEVTALAREAGTGVGSFPVRRFAELAAALVAREAPVVLDVRRPDEWDAGHLVGATHCFLADLPGRIADLPPGVLWVHCASGYRAGVAASVLARAGRSVVLVDDEWSNVASAGLEIEPGLRRREPEPALPR